MAELPIAPIGRLIKNAGAQRVSAGSEEAFRKRIRTMG
jgi:histone H3/H4